jgi:hypothetical protein
MYPLAASVAAVWRPAWRVAVRRERDRLASKIVELVQGGELDAQRLCRAALSDMREAVAAK